MSLTPEQIARIIAQRDRYRLALSLQGSAARAVAQVEDAEAFDYTINRMIECIEAYRAKVADHATR